VVWKYNWNDLRCARTLSIQRCAAATTLRVMYIWSHEAGKFYSPQKLWR
jgi:hypothetical protein